MPVEVPKNEKISGGREFGREKGVSVLSVGEEQIGKA